MRDTKYHASFTLSTRSCTFACTIQCQESNGYPTCGHSVIPTQYYIAVAMAVTAFGFFLPMHSYKLARSLSQQQVAISLPKLSKSSLSLFRLLWRRCMMLRKAAPSCRRKLLKPCASETLSYHSFCLSLVLEEYDYCCGRCCCSSPAAAAAVESAVMVWPYCHPS